MIKAVNAKSNNSEAVNISDSFGLKRDEATRGV
jgi:hypothetical protein